MPSVLRVEGFNFVMFFNDHSPAHVHAVRAGAWVIILIDGAEPVVRDVHEMKQTTSHARSTLPRRTSNC